MKALRLVLPLAVAHATGSDHWHWHVASPHHLTSSSWKFKAHLARNTAQEAPSPGAGGVRVNWHWLAPLEACHWAPCGMLRLSPTASTVPGVASASELG
jgi:hypothetical protein